VPLDTGDGPGGRVLVASFGMPSSGVPRSWAAGAERAGVDLVAKPSAASGTAAGERLRRWKRPGDITVVSVHWGANWGYDVSGAEVRFAHALVDAGVNLVHGHSSHHPRPLEVYRDRLILYGCGDFVDDYEGISGYERYRDDLRLLYLVSVEPGTGELAGVRMVPLQARRMRLCHASREDTVWLCDLLDAISQDFGCRVGRAPDGTLALRSWRGKGRR
jgi:poly-gamma-glutamate synthesis protein (capsule biosynthesis protein)